MRRGIGMLVAVSVLGGAFTAAGDAEAAWRRFNAASCMDDNNAGNPANLKFGSASGVFNIDTQTHWLACPVVEDSSLWVDSVTSVAVHVNASNFTSNGVSAKACVLFDTAVGGSCGAQVGSSGAVGPMVLFPSVSVWNQTWFGETFQGDFPYVNVGLSWVPSGNTLNSVRGYHITN